VPVPQDIGTFPNLRDIGEILLELFDARYSQYDPIYTKYFTMQTGERFTETLLSMVNPTQMEQVGFGQSTPFVDVLEAYKTTVSAQKWARGVQFTQEAVKFDRSGRLKLMPDRLARSANYSSEVEGARVINEMITTNHPDTGKPLVSTTQPLKRTGGTFSNRVDGDISVATLDAILVQFNKFVDDNNELLNIQPKFIVHTPDDGRVIRQLVGSTLEPYTSDNQTNDFKGRLTPFQNPFLTDQDSGVVLAGEAENGLQYVTWQDTTRKAWVDEDADVLKFKVTKIMKGTFDTFRGTIGYIGV
jgi:hypothetical protein